ncbi:MAG: TetR/AcrR family transcriptional regulator [Acidobacteriota bacterium]
MNTGSNRKRNRKYEARRLEILRSAGAAFSRQGFSLATMEEIAEALDMTKGNLYYYFRSKQELLYFCQRYSLDRLLAEAEQILSNPLPRPLQLHRLIVSQIRCMLDELSASSAHIEFRGLPEEQLQEIITRRDEYEGMMRRLVQEGIDSGEFYGQEARLAVWAILGAINWMVQWYSPQGELSVEDVARQFAFFLTSSLTGPQELKRSLQEAEESLEVLHA